MADTCQNIGDGDLYGIGVRIGLYLQWFAGLLLRNQHSSWQTISTVRVANNVLGISIMIASIVNTSRGITLATDFLLTYYLTIALFYAESYNLLKKLDTPGEEPELRQYYVLQPDVPLVLQNLLFAAASLFGGWFWIRGLVNTTQIECVPAKAAVIVSFDLYNPQWKVFAAAISIIAGLIFTFFFFGHLYIFCTGHVRSEPLIVVAGLLQGFSGGTRSGPHPFRGTIVTYLGSCLRPGQYDRKESYVTSWSFFRGSGRLFHVFIINLAGPMIAIASVETMIRKNRITTAGIFESTGQMVALIAGISSLCLASYEMLSKWREPKLSALQMLARMRYGSVQPIGDEELGVLQAYLTERFVSQRTQRPE